MREIEKERMKTCYHIQLNYHTVHLGFSKLLGKLVVKYVSKYTKSTLKNRSVKDLSKDACVIFSNFLYKSKCCGYYHALLT